jgi:hypothetical protein
LARLDRAARTDVIPVDDLRDRDLEQPRDSVSPTRTTYVTERAAAGESVLASFVPREPPVVLVSCSR